MGKRKSIPWSEIEQAIKEGKLKEKLDEFDWAAVNRELAKQYIPQNKRTKKV